MQLMVQDIKIKRVTFYLMISVVSAIVALTGYFIQREFIGISVSQPSKVSDSPKYLFSIVGDKQHSLRQPINAVVSPDGKLFVLDTGTCSVQVFGAEDGKWLFSFGKRGKTFGRFKFPYGLIVLPNGKVWVSDPENGNIQEFDERGNYIRTIVSADFQIKPGLMCIGKDSRVYVSELALHRIAIFDFTGKYRGEVRGNLNHPQGIQVDSKGHLWVVDEAAAKINEIQGKRVLRSFQAPEKVLPMGMVRGLAIDSLDRILVTQVFANSVLIFNHDGKLQSQFSDSGEVDGSLCLPTGLAVDSEGRIFVVDRGNGRVMVWGYPS